MGHLAVRRSGPMTIVIALWTLFQSWDTPSNFSSIGFALSSYILFCFIWLLSRRSLFFSSERPKEDRSGVKEELGGVEGV